MTKRLSLHRPVRVGIFQGRTINLSEELKVKSIKKTGNVVKVG